MIAPYGGRSQRTFQRPQDKIHIIALDVYYICRPLVTEERNVLKRIILG